MRIQKKGVIAVLAGLAVAAAVSASAASLGGAETSDIGANSNTVKAQLATGVRVTWTTAYNQTAGAYVVNGVNLTKATDGSALVLPTGAEVKLTLKKTDGTALGEYVGAVGAAGALTWSTTPAAVKAADVAGVSLVVNGGSVTAAVSTNG